VSDIPLCAGTIDAEVWGLPLVMMSQLRDTLACQIRVNVLDNTTTLAGPYSTTVAYPNDDTLYSTAFLDLRAGPQLLRVPSVSGRYVDFQLLDMYTNTIADVGVLTDGGHRGTYAFVGPGWRGNIPKGDVRIDVPMPDAWLLGRTQVNGPADLLTAVELEAQYSLAALSGRGSGTIGGPSTLACPAPALPSSTSLGFLDDLEKDMAADPPAAADGPVVRAMAAAGIGPGRKPAATSLAPTTWSAPAWRRRRSVRRSRPKLSTSVPAAPGQVQPLLRLSEPVATRSGSRLGTFRRMEPTASGRSRSTTPQGTSWPTR